MAFKSTQIRDYYHLTLLYGGKEYLFLAHMYHYFDGKANWYLRFATGKITFQYDVKEQKLKLTYLYDKKELDEEFRKALIGELIKFYSKK